MNKPNGNIIKINLDGYLADFIMSMLGANRQPVPVSKKNFFGSLIYRLIDKVPEDCRFSSPILPNKRILELEVSSLGGRDQERKRYFANYYFPLSKQREFESTVRDVFNELFFQTIEISREYTSEQYVNLIESFCNRYKIDFAENFDSLKKKHYRARQQLYNNC